MKKYIMLMLMIIGSIAKMNAMDDVFSLSIKTLTGVTITINICENATVGDLKEAIQKESNISIERQRIILTGKELCDSKATLKDLKVREIAILSMFVRPDEKQSQSSQVEPQKSENAQTSLAPARKFFYFTPYQKVGIGITAVVLTVALIRSYKNAHKETSGKI